MNNVALLRGCSLEELSGCTSLAGGLGRVQHVHSLGSERVSLPPLSMGRVFFEYMKVREIPAEQLWAADHYDSVAPPLFVLNDVMVHSSAGIIVIDDYFVLDTIANTDPDRNFYRMDGDAMSIRSAEIGNISHNAISILAGGCDNYYHWMIESVARLGLIPENYIDAADTLLIPENVPSPQRKLLDLLPISKKLNIRPVHDGETLRVKTLIFPGSVSANFWLHPCVRKMSLMASEAASSDEGKLPKRIYVDRRQSWARRLVNEDDLVSRITQYGFTPISPQNLSLEDQISLFKQAEIIVAPHGAGLSNIAYCPAHSRIIEIFMDSYVNWCFRHLSGINGLSYDCVVGRTLGSWTELSPDILGSQWMVSVDHVIAAVEQAIHR